jgi:hypothetical protein
MDSTGLAPVQHRERGSLLARSELPTMIRLPWVTMVIELHKIILTGCVPKRHLECPIRSHTICEVDRSIRGQDAFKGSGRAFGVKCSSTEQNQWETCSRTHGIWLVNWQRSFEEAAGRADLFILPVTIVVACHGSSYPAFDMALRTVPRRWVHVCICFANSGAAVG